MSQNSLNQYNVSFKRWITFCKKSNINNIYEASIPDVMKFLTEMFELGAQYGTLNSHRSALSLIIGSHVGSDDRLSRLFKGFYKLRPPRPKYDVTWDPSIVLDFLANFYPNSEIPLEHLTKKTATLLALVTAHRVQTLSKININNIVRGLENVNIKIPDIIKTSRPGSLQPCLKLPYFAERKEICPAESLLAYLDVTKTIRKSTNNLFISFKAPHRAVCSQTISRWIRDTLLESGIDTSIFTAHSTRHASTSVARSSGLNIDLIRKTAGWSEKSNVFAKYYHREIVNSNCNDFALSILSNN